VVMEEWRRVQVRKEINGSMCNSVLLDGKSETTDFGVKKEHPNVHTLLIWRNQPTLSPAK